ncbi:MAG TPA: DUF2637 domain-containing protein [Streptosporangiaceae bacterium]
MSEPLSATTRPAEPRTATQPGIAAWPSAAAQRAGTTGGSRTVAVIGIAAVFAGVAALAAATFVLSYNGIHQFALQAGIAPRYARGYPWLIDAMLVIVLAAALVLRGAGVPSKLFAWLCLVLLLAAAAGADALHAEGRRLPAHPAAVTGAVLPWGLVLVAFALLLTMLRHARLRRQRSRWLAPDTTAGASPERTELVLPGFAPSVPAPRTEPDAGGREINEGRAEAGPTADVADAAPDEADGPMLDDAVLDDALQADSIPDDAAVPDDAMLDGAAPDEAGVPDDARFDEAAADDGAVPADAAASDEAASNDAAVPGDDGPYDDAAGMPVFHRMWSAPSPPGTD